ncbi:hypothetical protein M513_11603 [Trichuris suis]|uniref:protein-ribulosamine 3-kinase n=1 Tax=Trichuris suis TaxID=68888 RepID=A0A085LRB3_9BILA|nr:hypothetical protein M513_11603 [Trichuris suis]
MEDAEDASSAVLAGGNICIFQCFNIFRVFKSGKLCALIAALLALQSFGLYGCSCIVLCTLFFLIGCFVRLFFYVWNVRYPMLLRDFDAIDWTSEKKFILPKLKAVTFDKNAKLPCSENVEKLINEIVDYTIRDYVTSWYSKLTNDDGFIKSVRCLFITALRVLIVGLKNVNWVTVLTHDVIDDFATHLRLFRKAKQKYDKVVSTGSEPRPDLLEQYFFEMEYELESSFCRKRLSMSKQGENEFLRSLGDVLVYLLLPTKDLSPHLFRLLLRDVLAVQVIGGTVNLICDPDYICHTVATLLFTVPLKYEDFITVLEATDDADELNGTMESLQQEIELQRSKDTGGADDSLIKQQLGSLFYLQKLIAGRLSRLQTSDSSLDEAGDGWQDCAAMYDLSLAFVLCNHVALCSFIDYLSQTDGKTYIDMYLTVEASEGFKNSFPHPSGRSSGDHVRANESLIISSAREVALEIYNQYFQAKSDRLVDIDEGIKKRLQAMIRSKVHPSLWFDEAQQRAYEILENDIRFYPSFKRSAAYVKLLAELKLLLPQDKSDETNPFSIPPTTSVLGDQADSSEVDSATVKDFVYETNIKTIGMGNEQSTIFAVYNIEVKKFDHRGQCMKHWIVTRRYSDFYNLNCVIKRKFPQLAKISFPAKKTFNNMHHGFLERRKRALNTYLKVRLHIANSPCRSSVAKSAPLQTLLDPALLKRCKGLENLLLEFLCRMDYNGDGGTLVEKLNSVVDPIRSGVKFVGNAVISMPDTLIDGVCKVGDGLGKVTRTVFGIQELTPSQVENFGGRVAASLNYESADSIPLRILMLLVDEIFGLQEQNQWIRRRMVSFLQQLIHAMYGSSLNRKIVEYVHWLTSEEQVTNYVKLFRNSMWPNGVLAESAPVRPQSTKARTRVVARTQTLSLLPDEFKLFIGNDSTTAGVCMVFEALQHECLNRRLCYVLLERLIVSVFPNRNVDQTSLQSISRMNTSDEAELRNSLETETLTVYGQRGGGCINQGCGYMTDNGPIFVKLNRDQKVIVQASIMFKGEFASLAALYAANCVIPIVRGALFAAEYIDGMSRLNKYAALLGKQLARLHLHNSQLLKAQSERESWVTDRHDDFTIEPVTKFGFHETTCCGFIPMDNRWSDDWVEFFTQKRLQAQYDKVMSDSGDRRLSELWPRVLEKIPSCFENCGEIVPCLLHGDLWSGNIKGANFGSYGNFTAVIFDPASFYGHSEFEFGIASIFGGFNRQFYDAYYELIPKRPGFEKRLRLYALFNYLNHWNHFGSAYRESTLREMKAIIDS